MHVSHPEQCRAGVLAGSDELADIRISRGNDTIERSDDLLEARELLQPLHIGARGLHLRVTRSGRGNLLVGFLLRDGVGRAQIAPALRGQVGDFLVGFGRREIGFRLAQLLIDFRGLDLGQQLAGLHRCADVDQPALQIATGARVDGRLVVRLDVARQNELGETDSARTA